VVGHQHEVADMQVCRDCAARVGGNQELAAEEGRQVAEPRVVEGPIALKEVNTALEQDDVLAVELPEHELAAVPDVRRDREVRDVAVVDRDGVVHLVGQALVPAPEHDRHVYLGNFECLLDVVRCCQNRVVELYCE